MEAEMAAAANLEAVALAGILVMAASEARSATVQLDQAAAVAVVVVLTTPILVAAIITRTAVAVAV
jgi:hypothetical protein